MAEPIHTSSSGPDTHCPLCKRIIKKPRKAKKLYDVPVCKRCRNKFANRRQAAYIIDGTCWATAVTLLFWLLDVESSAPPTPGMNFFAYSLGFGDPLNFVESWILPLVFLCKDGFNGMSPGKWLLGVQVVDSRTREPIRFWQSFKRNLILMVPFGILIVAFQLLRGRRWGDRWAKTAVIWRKYAYKPPFDPRGILCLECGYNLTGNVTGRCPECFTPIPGGAPAQALSGEPA